MRVPIQAGAVLRQVNDETKRFIEPQEKPSHCGPTTDCQFTWTCPEEHMCGPCWLGVPTCVMHFGTDSPLMSGSGAAKQAKSK